MWARMLECVAISFSRGSYWHRDSTGIFCSSCIADGFFTTEPPEVKWSEVKWSEVQVTQPCQTLCNPMDYTVHGILQARILEWVAFPFSRGSSQARDQTQVPCFAGRFFASWATRHLGSQLMIQEIHKWLTKTFIYFLPTSSHYSGLTEYSFSPEWLQ